MRVIRNGSAAFTVEFDSEAELREEHRLNLAHNALRLQTAETLPLHASVLLTLRGPSGGEAFAKATVVAALPDGIALAIEGQPDQILVRLLQARAGEEHTEASAPHASPAKVASDSEEKGASSWERIRGLSQMEKLLMAVKADRSERAVLLQDNDPRVLLSVLRNPRLTVEEVARMAKSSYVNYQIADVIVKTAQWMASVDVRLALVNNARTPPAFALRILPSLPVPEIRNIARGGTSMALKQAALKLLQGKG
jgi:hypothetical protein